MYDIEKQVTFSEISRSGKIDISRIADYFQDCASFHADSVGGGAESLREQLGCAWLLASWQIEVERYPKYGEKLKVCTKPYSFERVLALRNFMLYDEKGDRIAVANSYWFLIDTENAALIRMKDEVSGLYEMDEKEEMVYASRRISEEGAVMAAEPFQVGSYCIDTNLHMNNAWYIRHALSLVPEDREVRSVRAEYRMSAKEGDIIYPYTGMCEGSMKVLMADKAGEAFAVIEFGLKK